MPDARRDGDVRLGRLADEQAALRRVATLVAGGADPDELFSAVSDEVGRLFGAEASIARFEPDGAVVVVGLTQGIPVVSIGTRWAPEDFLASTAVFRTGRPARNDHTGHRDASGPVADSLRDMKFVSTVAAPIVVDGSLWGVITVSDARDELPPDTEERVERFTELVATAIANAESRSALARLVEEQAALRRVATLVAHGVGPDELFSAVTVEVGRLFGCEAGVVRFEPDDNAMVPVALTSGLGAIAALPRWPLDDFLASSVVYRTGRPARTPRGGYRRASGPLGDALRELKLVSTVAAPIVVEGSLWGVIAVTDADAELPRDTEERIGKFTELVAAAIANAENQAELAASEARAHDLAREQAALRRVATLVAEGVSPGDIFAAVVQEVAGVVECPVAALQRYEHDGTFTMVGITGETNFTAGGRWPVEDEGIAGMILATGRPARKDDYTTMPGPLGTAVRDDRIVSTVGIPIVVDGSIWGFITVGGKPGRPIPAGTETRLAGFTELAATAIADSQARERLARLAEEQAALRRVATLVARGVPPVAVFSAVSNEVARLFGSDQAAVARFESDGSAMVVVGVSDRMRLVSLGTRWEFEDFLAATAVYRTGRPARGQQSGFEAASGPIADRIRETGVISSVAAPIVVEGDLWGVMVVPDLRQLPDDAEAHLEKFTELVATAIANADSRGELAASRARVIAASDDARRRIERDLHDGAQQRLVTLAVALRRAQAKIPGGLEELRTDINRVGEGLTTAVKELRELSRGIHPAVLTEGGLDPALRALGRRSAVRVKLDIGCKERLPDPLEAAAYYTVSEALTNASKHADATRVRVSLDVEADTLRLSIRDDGVGGADPSRGSGLIGLKDRIEAIGGEIRIESLPSKGTRIDAKIPISSNQPVDAPSSGRSTVAGGARSTVR